MSSGGDPPALPITLRVLLTLAWPVILARSTQAVMGLADGLMTAPLGEHALAATTTGATNSYALVILPMGIVFIVQSFAAQLLGKGDLPAARRYAWYGLAVAALAGAVAIAAIPLIGPLVALLDNEPAVNALMTEYLIVRMFGIAAVVGTEALGNWFGGLGNTRPQMQAAFLAMGLDLFLNWVLIFGNLGAPALGVYGAALGSTIGSWLGLAYLALLFWRSKIGKQPHLGLRASELWRMLRFGLPNGINWFLEFAAFIVFLNVVVTHLGTIVLAAMNIVLLTNSVSFMPAFGLSSAGAILVGQTVGRGQLDRVWPILRLTATVAVLWQVAVGLSYFIAPKTLIGWFDPGGANGAELVAVGATLLAISAAWQLFDALSMTFGEALRAAGDTAWCLWARLVLAWLVFVPASCLAVFAFGLGHVAIILCMVTYIGLLALALGLRFKSGKWKEIDLTGIEAVPLV